MESRRFQDSDLEDIHFGSRKFQKRKGGGRGGDTCQLYGYHLFYWEVYKNDSKFHFKKGVAVVLRPANLGADLKCVHH